MTNENYGTEGLKDIDEWLRIGRLSIEELRNEIAELKGIKTMESNQVIDSHGREWKVGDKTQCGTITKLWDTGRKWIPSNWVASTDQQEAVIVNDLENKN
ncbi:MAG TPA: hypothetical protein VGZ90_13625 [Puia sp.]|jgi:hypothetical protein|nr:hypothetical protein [Puia sp.]